MAEDIIRAIDVRVHKRAAASAEQPPGDSLARVPRVPPHHFPIHGTAPAGVALVHEDGGDAREDRLVLDLRNKGAEGHLDEDLVGPPAHAAVLLPPGVITYYDSADVVRDAVVYDVAGNLVENVPYFIVACPSEAPDAPGRDLRVPLFRRGPQLG